LESLTPVIQVIEHLAEFSADREGRLFRGAHEGQLSESVYGRV